MDTTSTTSEMLTAKEAGDIGALYLALRETGARVGQASYLATSSVEEIRGSARVAEAIDAARDALANVLVTAEVYGHCRYAEAVRGAF